MLADWLASLLSIDRTTVVVLATLCGMGTWILRGQLPNPMFGLVVHPLLTTLTVFIYVMMQASGMIEPMILTDWIKGILASTMVGHGIGIAIGMLILVMVNDKAEAVENDLTKRAAKNQAPKRTARRDFRESLR